jgi:hypothetical protein
MIISHLNKFKINNEYINNYSVEKVYKKENNTFQKGYKKENNNIVKEELNYSLFWCFYKIIYGDFNYFINKGFKEEIKTKIKIVEEIRSKKIELKQNKIKITNIETELINNKDITVNSLHALSILYNINIIYIYNLCYYDMIQNDDENIFLIIKKNNNYELIKDNNKKIDYYKNNYYQITNLSKPIKAINNYSKEELVIYSKKLNIEIPNKANKNIIYEKIKIECNKFI